MLACDMWSASSNASQGPRRKCVWFAAGCSVVGSYPCNRRPGFPDLHQSYTRRAYSWCLCVKFRWGQSTRPQSSSSVRRPASGCRSCLFHMPPPMAPCGYKYVRANTRGMKLFDVNCAAKDPPMPCRDQVVVTLECIRGPILQFNA